MTENDVIIEFEIKDDKFTSGADKIIEAAKQIESAFKDNVEKSMGDTFDKVGKSAKNASKRMKDLNNSSKSSKAILAGIGAASGKAMKSLVGFVKESAEFVGVQTKFNAVFDKTNGELEDAQKWVDDYADKLYLDKKAVTDTVASFMIFNKTLGLSSEKSKEISLNMTQLANDMAAVYNVDASTMTKQIESALAGQTKALKQYGVVINNTILQDKLYELGINRKISSLNAAEKAELTYYYIMQQTAGQQGYLAKTLLSPANAANILKNQFTELGRAIGNVFLPILMKLLPVVVALTKALTNLAQRIANVFGIKIDFDQYSADLSSVSAGIDDIGDSADSTSKKIKNMARDFDDLHVVDFGDDSSSGSGTGTSVGGSGGLGLDTQQYADWSKYLDDASDKLDKIQDLVKILGTALGALTISKLLSKFLELIGLLDKSNELGFVLGTTLAAVGFKGIIDINAEIWKTGKFEAKEFIKTIVNSILAGGGTAISLISLGVSPALALKIGVAISLISLGITLLNSFASAIKEKYNEEIEGIKKEEGWYEDGTGLGKKIAIILKISWFIISDTIKDTINRAADKIGQFYTDRVKNAITRKEGEVASTVTPLMENMVNKTKEETSKIEDTIDESGNTIKSSITTSLGETESTISTETAKINSSVGTNFDKMAATIGLSVSKAKTTTKDGFWKMNNEATLASGSLNKNVSNNYTTIDTSFKTKPFEDAMNKISASSKTASDEVKTNLEGIGNAKIKMPHFSWTSTPASGWIAKTLEALNLPTSLPKLNVSWYETGGFPNKGDLFIANEREPELIGTMGNKTTVANNTQIIEGIASASYSGMKRALSEAEFGGGDTLVYVGTTQITDVVTKKQKLDNKRFGR